MQIDSNPKCVVLLQSSEECHVTFSFVEHSSVVVSTLTLRWRGSRGHLPAAHWNTQLVALSELGLRENDVLHIQGTLVSRCDCLKFYSVLRKFSEKFVKYSYLIRYHIVFCVGQLCSGSKSPCHRCELSAAIFQAVVCPSSGQYCCGDQGAGCCAPSQRQSCDVSYYSL